jgi:hypothetical protein
LKVHLHHFSKIKSQKESQNSRNQGFSYYFCMMMEGSGSGRPKNMWVRWIRIRIRSAWICLCLGSGFVLGQSIRIQKHGNRLKLTNKPGFLSVKKGICTLLITSKYYFHVQIKLVVLCKSDQDRIRIRIGLARWIRIQIKRWIRICIQTNADRQQWFQRSFMCDSKIAKSFDRN